MEQFHFLENIKQFFIILVAILVLSSCLEKGEASQSLVGQEENLPTELKGLKVYRVGTGGGNEIQVAVLNGQAVATSYKEGKYDEYVAIVNEGSMNIEERTIHAKEIISENDSIIVLRK